MNEKAKELGPGITDLIVSTISSNIRQVELLKLDLNYQDLIRGNDLIPIEQVASSEQWEKKRVRNFIAEL